MLLFLNTVYSILNSVSNSPNGVYNPELGGSYSGVKDNIANNIQKSAIQNDPSGRVGKEVLNDYKGLQTNAFNPKVTNKSEINNGI